jgi:hypothetical protein
VKDLTDRGYSRVSAQQAGAFMWVIRDGNPAGVVWLLKNLALDCLILQGYLAQKKYSPTLGPTIGPYLFLQTLTNNSGLR